MAKSPALLCPAATLAADPPVAELMARCPVEVVVGWWWWWGMRGIFLCLMTDILPEKKTKLISIKVNCLRQQACSYNIE